MAEKAQVGDLIRVVDAEPYSYDTYKDGDILEVIGRFEVGDGVEVKETDLDGDTMLLYDTEYVIHRKAGEEDVEKPKLHCDYCGKQIRGVYSRCTTGNYCGDACAEEGSNAVIAEKLAKRGAEETQADAVDHPSHYTQGRFETIEIIEEVTQGYSDGYVAYCVGNALKYLARAPFKHESPSEDIAKARAYLDFAAKRLGGYQ